MEWIGLWTAVGTIGGLVLLLILGRRNEEAVKRDWELLLSARGRREYERVERRVRSEIAFADLTYEKAFAVRALGSMDDAIRLLDVGYKVIERFAPDLMRLLSSMATFSRMVAAMAPLEPLRPRDYALAEVVTLAQLNRLLHQFLVSTAERFRLRIYIIGRGFGVAIRYLLRSTERIANREPGSDREWEQIEAIRRDFLTLTEESLHTLRALMASLEAEKRQDALVGVLD